MDPCILLTLYINIQNQLNQNDNQDAYITTMTGLVAGCKLIYAGPKSYSTTISDGLLKKLTIKLYFYYV
jgi:hypothetical protein